MVESTKAFTQLTQHLQAREQRDMKGIPRTEEDLPVWPELRICLQVIVEPSKWGTIRHYKFRIHRYLWICFNWWPLRIGVPPEEFEESRQRIRKECEWWTLRKKMP